MADMVTDQSSLETINIEDRKAAAQELMKKASDGKQIDMEAFISAEQEMSKAVALERLAKK